MDSEGPLPHVNGHVLKGEDLGVSGAGHEDVESIEVLLKGIEQHLRTAILSQLLLERDSLATAGLDVSDHLLCSGLIGVVRDCDSRTLSGEPASYCSANSSACTSDQSHLTSETVALYVVHATPPVWASSWELLVSVLSSSGSFQDS